MKEYSLSVIEDIMTQKIRKQYIKIFLMDWNEVEKEEITGLVKTGSYTENGNNSSRRTLTLSFSSIDKDNELIINKLKMSKKIKIQFGFENTTNKSIVRDDILWFDLGIYIPISVSLSHTTATSTINLSCSDKMSLLNGTLGGMVSTPTTFAIKKNDTYQSMTWRDIFINIASTIGNENPGKIIIENVPDLIRVVGQIKKMYGTPEKMIFIDAPDNVQGNRCIVEGWHPDMTQQEIKEKLFLFQGEKIYGLKKFAPPEPTTINNTGTTQDGYIVNIGENITKVFEDIKKQLNNAHQYYYDVEGNLRLEPIHDYMVYEQDDNYYQNHHYDLDTDLFKPDFTRMPITYDYTGKDTVISYSNTQKFSNIKNDFVLSGKNGKKIEIAIDKKISTEEIIQWFQEASNIYSNQINKSILDYCNYGMEDKDRQNIYYKTKNDKGEDIHVVRYPTILNKDGKPVKYVEVQLEGLPWQIAHGIRSWHLRQLNNLGGSQVNNFSIESIYSHRFSNMNFKWGYECEQLIYQKTVDENNKWIGDKGIFNLENWKKRNGNYWKTGYTVDKMSSDQNENEVVDYTTPNFDSIGDSSTWNYWFDIIPARGIFEEFSIDNIGRRTFSQKMEDCNMIFRTGYHDIIIIEEDYLNQLENKEYILKTLKDKKTPYVVVKNATYFFTQLSTFLNTKTQEIEEPDKFVIDSKTKIGLPGEYNPTKGLMMYCGGMYTGSTQGIQTKDYDLTEVDSNHDNPTDLLFFPYNESESDVVFAHPKTKKETEIPKGTAFIEQTNSLGKKEKTFGSIVAIPTNYPFQTPNESPTSEELDRIENEKKSPLFIMFSQKRADKKLEHLDDRFHNCFVCGRFNNKTQRFEYWGVENNKYSWYDYIPSEGDSMIGYAVDNNQSIISYMFNMEKGDMSNIFSYNSDNDLFNSIIPIIVQKTNFADSITISCLMNPYLQTNTLIKVSDKKSNIDGIYKINSINYSLGKSTMSIQATKMNKYLI